MLAPLYASGAVGIAADGTVSLRDAAAVPLAQRAQANAAVAAENADRAALYREIGAPTVTPEGGRGVPHLRAVGSSARLAGGCSRALRSRK